MLNHLLAGFVGLGGLSLFLSGFFFPEVQRKPDFAWSGVALLYALVLWIEGDHTSGGALLGHIASVALIAWFGWQTLQQRREFAASDAQTAIPNSFETLMPFLKTGWGRMATAYGEASNWVKTKLAQDDALIAPEGFTQTPQTHDEAEDEWDVDANRNLETAEGIATELPQSLMAEPTPEPPSIESPTVMVATVSESEGLDVSDAPAIIEAPESLAEPPLTDIRNNDDTEWAESDTEAHNVSPMEMPSTVITPPAVDADFQVPEVVPEPGIDPSSENIPPKSNSAELTPDQPSEHEKSPSVMSDASVSPDLPNTSSHPEDDGSWPPPELEP